MNIYVSNLSFNVQDEDLKEFFAEYGEVTSAKVITDKFTGRSRGFGFVEMSDDAAAQKAIQELDGATVEGRAIKVSEAKPREQRPSTGGSGGGGGRSGGGGGRNFGGGSGGGGNRWSSYLTHNIEKRTLWFSFFYALGYADYISLAFTVEHSFLK
jgi:RNA recognition motif-containing protein